MSADKAWYAGDLPTFEEIRRETLKQLGDAADTLRSDWLDGTGPNDRQADAVSMVRQHIALAKELLDQSNPHLDVPFEGSQGD
jgi:hypothetical protein